MNEIDRTRWSLLAGWFQRRSLERSAAELPVRIIQRVRVQKAIAPDELEWINDRVQLPEVKLFIDPWGDAAFESRWTGTKADRAKFENILTDRELRTAYFSLSEFNAYAERRFATTLLWFLFDSRERQNVSSTTMHSTHPSDEEFVRQVDLIQNEGVTELGPSIVRRCAYSFTPFLNTRSKVQFRDDKERMRHGNARRFAKSFAHYDAHYRRYRSVQELLPDDLRDPDYESIDPRVEIESKPDGWEIAVQRIEAFELDPGFDPHSDE